jgi:hypothetical protein
VTVRLPLPPLPSAVTVTDVLPSSAETLHDAPAVQCVLELEAHSLPLVLPATEFPLPCEADGESPWQTRFFPT